MSRLNDNQTIILWHVLFHTNKTIATSYINFFSPITEGASVSYNTLTRDVAVNDVTTRVDGARLVAWTRRTVVMRAVGSVAIVPVDAALAVVASGVVLTLDALARVLTAAGLTVTLARSACAHKPTTARVHTSKSDSALLQHDVT